MAKICFLSMNNEKEFIEFNNLINRLNKSSENKKISVVELIRQGDKPNTALKRTLDSKTSCQGLVISGHHTGGFGGKQVQGTLNLDYLEKLSCNPEYSFFFNKIKSVWLQGCRTLGAQLTSLEDENADFHMQRVGNLLDEDGLEQSFADLNLEFSLTLDQENPISSRYLRVFPNATLFGWTGTAPGEKAGSEKSLFYHIMQLTKLNHGNKFPSQSPFAEAIDLVTLRKYFDAAFSFLYNSDVSQSKLVNAWSMHGAGGLYAFNNKDLKAYESLYSSNNSELIRAKEIDCILNDTINQNNILKVLDEVVQSTTLMGYSISSIYSLYQTANPDFKLQLKNKLISKNFTEFLIYKINKKETGILRKIEYYFMLSNILDKKIESIEQKILTLTYDLLFKLNFNNYGSRDFMSHLLVLLSKNNLIMVDFIYSTIRSPALTPQILSLAMDGVIALNMKPEQNILLLKELMALPHNSESSLNKLLLFMQINNFSISDLDKYILEILSHSRATDSVYHTVARSIGSFKQKIENVDIIFNTLLNVKSCEESVLMNIASSIGGTRYEIKNVSDIFFKILSCNNKNKSLINNLKYALNYYKFPIEKKEELQRIVNSL